LPLWLEALARPESDLKRQAADAIAKAHQLGMPGLAEAVPPLLKEYEAPEAPLVVRLAVARALVVLDARQAAEVLMHHAQADGFSSARLLEPVLARWDYAPMRRVWLARLESRQTPPGLLLLAIQAVALTKLVEAAPHLSRLAMDGKAGKGIRLEAARVLASFRSTGLEEEARRLVDDAGPRAVIDRLVAATLLMRHRGAEAETLLLRLAADAQPAVAVVAGTRLAEIDPNRLKSLLDGFVASSDAGLRHLAARVLAELRTPEAVARLGPLLDDSHRDVRVLVRESLVRLLDLPGLAEPVQQAAMRVLSAKGPRGHEQAAIVVGAVGHKPASDRLVQLLHSHAGEVRVAAAWALRRLAVPATAAAILEKVQAATNEGRRPMPRTEGETMGETIPRDVTFHEAGHLIEALGVMRYRPAVPLLKEYLPLPPPPLVQGMSRLPANLVWQNTLRAAAVWSLGQIYAGDPQADMTATLRQRLEKEDADPVRVMAAVSIARMKAKDLEPALRQFYQDETESPEVRLACACSLERLTGAPVPPPKFPSKAREIWSSSWFLEPLQP
jgi:HEAT repeat protein